MRTNFSFSGCGFLGIYHVGVATCIKEHAPEMFEDCRIAGASAGCFMACCLLSGCSLGKCTSYTLNLANEANTLPLLGPLHPRFNIIDSLRKALAEVLPADAHKRTSGRLYISLTRWRDWKNVVISEYASNQELIDAMICSAFVPLYCGLIPPKYKGDYYWDGGLSDNQPIFDEPTITVSPFSGEIDICPLDNSANFIHLNVCNSSVQFTSENLSRISIALFPPNAQKLSDICKQGYDDALRYLQNNGLINCTRHLRITTTIEPPSRDGRVMSVSERDWANIEKEIKHGITEGCSDCGECKSKVKEALSTSLPPQVLEVLQSAMIYNKKSFVKYLRQGKIHKAISMMIKPWLIPADILFSFLIRCLKCIPQVHQDFDKIIEELPHFINNLFHKHHKYETKLEYHCAFTEDNFQMNQTNIELPSSAIDINLVMNCEGFPKEETFQTSTELSGGTYDTATVYREQTSKDPVSALNSMRNCNQIQDGVSDAVLDQFKLWLEAANNNDATIAYYYLDTESNTMKVEQIFNIPEDSRSLEQMPECHVTMTDEYVRRRKSAVPYLQNFRAQRLQIPGVSGSYQVNNGSANRPALQRLKRRTSLDSGIITRKYASFNDQSNRRYQRLQHQQQQYQQREDIGRAEEQLQHRRQCEQLENLGEDGATDNYNYDFKEIEDIDLYNTSIIQASSQDCSITNSNCSSDTPKRNSCPEITDILSK
ncbi:patanin-like phospholipase domain-containing 2 [Octopus vulgaris]|uniref:Patanin-like phospholipase domain-containing 2 n=2 Tax=Octopus TaxID=6643 RepID=A0AA36BU95_OCTVU|nr:patanin-like phospholipase domain-containing protein atgl-1 isoform X2 [Octopus sinensis]XP_029651234.1 patanin-like phospholipase domain-containing protein atgl-1 isoform X2 [Octopus sinensis]XP_036369328.1 patanin-like phospholipase domain-containing protein atgl-1 isoform X2 [Octopus sinensis]XP_036369329.1 patanin-like phospholipase domain-containing protein atgl-1 isoform X2 [Octopus sinensis]CAI9740701.1 patanin-like phospholipase domain-containing 2 [Octopus vulgaris]